jgi:hypothetical protein
MDEPSSHGPRRSLSQQATAPFAEAGAVGDAQISSLSDPARHQVVRHEEIACRSGCRRQYGDREYDRRTVQVGHAARSDTGRLPFDTAGFCTSATLGASSCRVSGELIASSSNVWLATGDLCIVGEARHPVRRPCPVRRVSAMGRCGKCGSGYAVGWAVQAERRRRARRQRRRD